jgi:VWFA-related protein
VKDARGHYVGGLSEESFRVYDNNQLQEIVSFQNFSGEFACAIVLDTTGSMQEALPVLKNAVMELIDRFRPGDLFGLYSFNSGVRQIQEFTHDRAAAKRAVLRLQPGGATALFDTISQVSRGLEDRKGKVAVIVFTDGDDNASALTINSAVERVKRLGMPVYTVAQGEALRNRKLLDQLQSLASMTGGASYSVRHSNDVDQVFSDISRDLQNTYMLAYYAPPAKGSAWRRIQVTIPSLNEATIRTKQGYIPK